MAMRNPVPRLRAVQQLGRQNLSSLYSDTRNMGRHVQQQGIVPLDAPAANRYRQMQAADPAGPYSGLSSAYTPQRLMSAGNSLGLARTPTVPGEGATSAIAYNPGAAGSSPFVSDGPLSGGPRGQEIQGRLDMMKQRLGIATPSTPMMGGSQLPSERRVGQLGTLAQATRDGGIRLIGPVAQQTLARTGMTADALSAQRDNIIGGTPTTFVDNGDGVRDRQDIRALHPEQQANMDLRGQRTADVREFLQQRGRGGRQSTAPAGAPSVIPGGPPAETQAAGAAGQQAAKSFTPFAYAKKAGKGGSTGDAVADMKIDFEHLAYEAQENNRTPQEIMLQMRELGYTPSMLQEWFNSLSGAEELGPQDSFALPILAELFGESPAPVAGGSAVPQISPEDFMRQQREAQQRSQERYGVSTPVISLEERQQRQEQAKQRYNQMMDAMFGRNPVF